MKNFPSLSKNYLKISAMPHNATNRANLALDDSMLRMEKKLAQLFGNLL